MLVLVQFEHETLHIESGEWRMTQDGIMLEVEDKDMILSAFDMYCRDRKLRKPEMTSWLPHISAKPKGFYGAR